MYSQQPQTHQQDLGDLILSVVTVSREAGQIPLGDGSVWRRTLPTVFQLLNASGSLSRLCLCSLFHFCPTDAFGGKGFSVNKCSSVVALGSRPRTKSQLLSELQRTGMLSAFSTSSWVAPVRHSLSSRSSAGLGHREPRQEDVEEPLALGGHCLAPTVSRATSSSVPRYGPWASFPTSRR